MSQNFAVQGCRIVPPERLPDRFMAVDILRGTSDQPGVAPVVLSYIFEVAKPWFPSSHLVPSLQEILEQYLPSLQSGPGLVDQFESLLKKINLQLNDISESGETDWIGNFNALIMVLGGDELHFSQAGFCPSYILQNRRIRQITDEEHESDPHPLKTFANLASGSLQADDIVLIANPELYKEISLDALRRTLSSITPYKACDTIAKELKKEKNAGVAMITLKILDPGIASTLPAEPEAILMEEIMQSALAKIKKVVRPVAHKTRSAASHIGRLSVDAARQTGTIMKDQVVPKAGQFIHAGSEQIKHATDKLKENQQKAAEQEPEIAHEETTEPAPEQPAETPAAPGKDAAAEPSMSPVVEIIGKQEAPMEEEPEDESLESEQEDGSSDTDAEESEKPETIIPLDDLALDSDTPPPVKPEDDRNPDSQGLLKTAPAAVSSFLVEKVGHNVILPFIGHAILLLQKPRNRRLAFLVLALILIGLTFLLVANRKPESASTSSGKGKNDEILTQVRQLKSKIDTSAAANQSGQVNSYLNEADSLINTLINPSDSQKSEAETLWSAMTAKFDTVSKTNRLATPASSYSFTTTSDGLIVELPYYYGFSGGNLLRSGVGDAGVTQKSIPLPVNDGDSIVALSHSTDTGSVGYILTKKARVYRILQSDTVTTLQQVSGTNFNAGDRIASFNGNIYILDFRSGLLWKYLRSDTGYQKGVTAIDNTKYDLRDTSSLAIDGGVYLLKNNAVMDKYYSGKKQESFSLTGIPQGRENLIKPSQVITDEDIHGLFVLDCGKSSSIHSTGRLLEFSKDGAFSSQYAFPSDLTDVRAVDVSPQQDKLWVLNGKDVNEFNL